MTRSYKSLSSTTTDEGLLQKVHLIEKGIDDDGTQCAAPATGDEPHGRITVPACCLLPRRRGVRVARRRREREARRCSSSSSSSDLGMRL